MVRREQFEVLVEEHKKILYKVCNSYCRNPDDREDLAQEIVIQLWRSFNRYDGRAQFSTWMYRVALNVAISFYRRETARSRHLLATDTPLLEVADERQEATDEIRALYQAIDKLDPLNKALILLYLDGHSYAEISEVLGISESNAATKVGRVKDAFKKELRGTA